MPSCGTAGTFVTISGSGFAPAPIAVTFNGAPALLRTVTGERITTTVPIGATTGPVLVTTPRGLHQRRVHGDTARRLRVHRAAGRRDLAARSAGQLHARRRGQRRVHRPSVGRRVRTACRRDRRIAARSVPRAGPERRASAAP